MLWNVLDTKHERIGRVRGKTEPGARMRAWKKFDRRDVYLTPVSDKHYKPLPPMSDEEKKALSDANRRMNRIIFGK